MFYMTVTAEPATTQLPAPAPQRQKITATSTSKAGGTVFWRATINITRNHITEGTPHSSTSCALALAARDAGINMTVGKDGISRLQVPLTTGGKTTTIDAVLRPTREMRDFVRRFDAGEAVEPFTLRLWASA